MATPWKKVSVSDDFYKPQPATVQQVEQKKVLSKRIEPLGILVEVSSDAAEFKEQAPMEDRMYPKKKKKMEPFAGIVDVEKGTTKTLIGE